MSRFRVLLACGLLFPLVPAAAQQSSGTGSHTTAKEPFGRLHVRPHAMAIGTTNAKVGVDSLPGFNKFYVYVPKNCVGAQRCPLVVYVHGGGWSSTMQIDAQRDLADKYGMILLLPNSVQDGAQEIFVGVQNGRTQVVPSPMGYTNKIIAAPPDTDVRLIDSAMTAVLHTHAIDPDKIAVMGFSNGGSYSLLLGRNNLDVFSRVGGLSALFPFYGEGPKNDKTMFLISGGVAENMVERVLGVTKELRAEGQSVETVLALRGHIALREDDNYAWNWLARSWGWHTPASAKEGPPKTPTDSDVVLTVDGLKKLTDFWTRFQQEPDSIQSTARPGHYGERRPGHQGGIVNPFMETVTMNLGPMPVTIVKTDMVALAAAYPSVAADLKAAGLTAPEEESLRRAVIRVGFTRVGRPLVGEIPPASVLGQNLAFRVAHPAEFKALLQTQIWTTQ